MLSPITLRRLQHFRANRRGYWSLWIFLSIFFVCIFAEVVANDKPLLVIFEGHLIFPVIETIPETEFGGEFATEAEYRDEFVRELIEKKGLYPITIIPEISKKIKEKLFNAKIILAKDLANHKIEELIEKTNLNKKTLEKILEKAKAICSNK